MASEEKCNSAGGGGYLCKFVDESQPNDLFKCRVCALILRDPHITKCCGENACHLCIVKAAENGGPCPIPGCRSKSVKINLNRDLQSIILESGVYCQSKEAGCEWVGKLDELTKHLKECPFVEEICPHNCGILIQRQNIKEHTNFCGNLSVECNKCGEFYKRHYHSLHVKAYPFTIVECPFEIVGCKYEVQNKDLHRHFNESISEHSMLVAMQSQKVLAQIRETKVIIEQQRREKLDCYVTEADKIKDDLMAAQSRISILQKKLEEAKQRHKELTQRHVQKELKLQSQKDTRLQLQLKADLEHLITESRVKCYGPAFPRLHPSEIISRPLHSPKTTNESVPPVMFMIPNFNTERRNDARIYLPPFYAHRRGYKLSMIVCCNGDGDAEDKYLTVYMSTLKGLYDTSLGWPLNCTVRLRIMDVDLEVNVNSHARVLDDCGFSSNAHASTHRLGVSPYARHSGLVIVYGNTHYRLGLSQFKNLPGDCLCIQVCSVFF